MTIGRTFQYSSPDDFDVVCPVFAPSSCRGTACTSSTSSKESEGTSKRNVNSRELPSITVEKSSSSMYGTKAPV